MEDTKMKLPIQYRRTFPFFGYRSAKNLYREHLEEQLRRAKQFRDCMILAAAKGWPLEFAVIVDGVACSSSLVDSKGKMSCYIAEAACGLVMTIQSRLEDHDRGMPPPAGPAGDIAQ